MVVPSLLVLLLALLNLNGLCQASQPTLNHTSLERRQCVYNAATDRFDICNQFLPTVAQIVARMRDPSWEHSSTPGTITFFYTNLAEGAVMRDATQREELLRWCVAWLRSQGMEKTNFALNIMDNRWLRDQIWHIQNGPDGDSLEQQWGDDLDGVEDIFQRCYLQSLSLAVASPDVVLFTRSGMDWDPESDWATVEYWPLTRTGGIVERIWRVDPRPNIPGAPGAEAPCALPSLMWQRGRDQPLTPDWRCPVFYDDGSMPNLPDPWAPFVPPPNAPPPVVEPPPIESSPVEPTPGGQIGHFVVRHQARVNS